MGNLPNGLIDNRANMASTSVNVFNTDPSTQTAMVTWRKVLVPVSTATAAQYEIKISPLAAGSVLSVTVPAQSAIYYEVLDVTFI